MRLDFNVLWVDDQPSHVTAQIKTIAARMAEEGFEFQPTQCRTIQEMENALTNDVFTDEVDLILVDWDLGNNIHGEDVIEHIREKVQNRNVVFYSGETPAAELRHKAHEKHLEGVYCASRGDLVDEVIDVFESLIKKVLDLDHTRGIVMGATSDIDHMVNTCLSLAHGKLDDVGKAELMERALCRVDKKVDRLRKLGNDLKDKPSMEALFKAHMLFTSDDRLQLLSITLAMPPFAAYSAHTTAIDKYRKDVVQNRNTLGHVVLVPNGKPNKVINDSGKEVNIDKMRELRKLILSLRVDFRALLDALQA